jgi:hypothetical protein
MTVRIVSDQSEADIRKRQDSDHLKASLREMAANLLRIVRGAGSAALGRQMVQCIEAYQRYRDSHGHYPPHDFVLEALNPDKTLEEYRPWILERTQEDEARWYTDGTMDEKYALRQIRNGALQIAASLLVNQLTQMSRGESELLAGTRALEAAHEKRRKAHSPPVPRSSMKSNVARQPAKSKARRASKRARKGDPEV